MSYTLYRNFLTLSSAGNQVFTANTRTHSKQIPSYYWSFYL
ncbi:hypothetical protein SALWKB2_0193 [Snodgrassella alvi wkB2]|nr:hypothetical protein SALWKB2_0193 [Snodgrassella alvi wkB2]